MSVAHLTSIYDTAVSGGLGMSVDHLTSIQDILVTGVCQNPKSI